MSALTNALKQSPAVFGLVGASVAGTATALVVLALGHPAAAIITLLITVQVLLVGVAHQIAVSYRRQEKRARTWGVRHSTGQYQLGQALSAQRIEFAAERHDAAAGGQLEQLVELRATVDELLGTVRAHVAGAAEREAAEQQVRRRAAFHEVFGHQL